MSETEARAILVRAGDFTCFRDRTGQYMDIYAADFDVRLRAQIERIFTCGDCHHLARAVHELTGWPLVAGSFIGIEEFDVAVSVDGRRPAGHAAVRHPSGKLLDIEGLHEDTEAFWQQYECDFSIDVAPDDFDCWHGPLEATPGLIRAAAAHLAAAFAVPVGAATT